MGEVDIEAMLRRENPKARAIDIRVVADALRTYLEAAENVVKNGAIVSHPRTGAPIDNPYLKVQQSLGKVLLGERRIKSDTVLAALGVGGA